ncbi:MAG: M1 family metallopeptidase [Bacteroidota bacterium]
MQFRFLWLFGLPLFLLACGAGKKATTIPEVIVEETDLDTLTVSAPREVSAPPKVENYRLPRYNPSYQRRNDLLHTRLDLRFDWEQQTVIGKAGLTLKPLFYPVRSLVLDAQNFDIHRIQLNNQDLKYEYDQQVLTIQLDREYRSEEQYRIEIDYTANPTKGAIGGSAAITSDQGLFFINPDGSDPDKPMQIWTQGETEYNSRWFPTIDKPIERSTQEVYLTVKERFQTLSNGILVASKSNDDGTRTDYWKMDKAHAPYLFMLAIGEYAIVKDKWRDILVDYYVEPDYEEDARAIFANTVEMLEFFSNLLGVDYPWQKYSQVVVRDFVSGAMENTTSVVFGEFVQRTTRELIDNHNDRIVAHEMFHHWFGDFVTCESWANLTLNEGFANYSEYLWTEHKYGIEAADHLLRGDQEGYLQSTGYTGIHPLIHFAYEDKEDMFDAHSYNKGGIVMHMLRNYLGDEAFYAGLKKYLLDNAYTAVESHELRMAFEDICGEDLNWFFDQWYFSAGHPLLSINYEYDEEKREVVVRIEQQQDPETNPPIFVLPMGVDVYLGEGEPAHHDIVVNERTQIFRFPAAQRPQLVNVDSDKMTLGIKRDNKSENEWIFQYKNGPKYLDRWEALNALQGSLSPAAREVFVLALQDSFWALRELALAELAGSEDPTVLQTISQLAEKDERSDVRATALAFLGATERVQYADLFKRAIKNDPSYPGMAAALISLVQVAPEEALSIAKDLESEKNPGVVEALVQVYGLAPDIRNLPYFQQHTNTLDEYGAFSYFDAYLGTIQVGTPEQQQEGLQFLISQGKENSSPWRRLGAVRSLYGWTQLLDGGAGDTDVVSVDRVRTAIQEIIREEKDPQLQEIYKQLQ